MDLATIVIEPSEALERAKEYRDAFRLSRSTEDEAMAQGFRAAARGLPIIELSKVIAAGGFFDSGLPHLAIARADATECFVGWHWREMLTFGDSRFASNTHAALVGRHVVNVRADKPAKVIRWNGHTMVPNVPPRHRPKRGRLHNFHILWEVEEWTLTPPRDPALLRHIRGDLWSVLAVWDLTDLERAVLAQRAR